MRVLKPKAVQRPDSADQIRDERAEELKAARYIYVKLESQVACTQKLPSILGR